MNKAKDLILIRFPKFFAGSLLGALVDTLVIWVFSHFVFHNYVGRVIRNPSALCVSGIFNFSMDEFVIFKKKKAI